MSFYGISGLFISSLFINLINEKSSVKAKLKNKQDQLRPQTSNHDKKYIYTSKCKTNYQTLSMCSLTVSSDDNAFPPLDPSRLFCPVFVCNPLSLSSLCCSNSLEASQTQGKLVESTRQAA